MDLPPSLSNSGDLPPSLSGQPGPFRRALQATDLPKRGLRGVGVGVENLIEGKPPEEALERASEATQKGYHPKEGEKIGSFVGESLDPRFMLFGALGEAGAATAAGKAVMGGAAALGGTEAVEETAEKGSPTLKGTGVQTALGAAAGGTIYAGIRALEPVLGPVMSKAGEFLKSLFGKKDPVSFGKVVEAGESIVNRMGEGKTIQDVSKEMGIGEDTARQAVDKWEKAKPHVVDTSLLPTIDKAIQGDPESKLNILQRVLKNVYTSPTEASSTAENLFRRRYSEIALGKFESHLFARDALKGLSDVDRQALPFILEKKVPEADRFFHPKKDQILQTAEGYLENSEKFPQLKAAVEKIGSYLDEGHKFLKEYYDDIGFREDYINHIWDKPPEVGSSGPGKASLSQYNPFSKRRFIASYAEGINQGLTPKTLDIGDLLGVYDNYKIKAVANARFVDSLKDIKVEGNFPAVMEADKAPKDWQLIDNTALNKKRLIPGEEGNPSVFVSQAVRVSPEVAPAVRAIIEKPFATVNPGPHANFIEKAFYHGTNAYEYLNSVTKKLKLSLSFFHHYSLTETAALAGSPTAPIRVLAKEAKQILNDGGMNPAELYKAFKEGHAAYNNIPVAKDALSHGLNLGPIGDVQSSRFTKVLSETEGALRKIPPLQKGIHALREFNDIWDKALWDYYYSGLKLDLYERQVSKNIKNFGATVPVEKIKRDTAEFINKAAGGSLENMMISPRYKQAMQWALLAPDWTLGRLELFGSVFSPGVQGAMGRKFWLKAAIAYGTMINAWNYHNTAKAGLKGPNGEEGRFLWQNEEGKKLHLFWDKDENGRNEYILPAKAITEVVGWLFEPVQTLGRKLSPTIQIMTEALTGHTVGGYKVPDQDKTLGGYIRRYEAPISVGKQNVFMTFPRAKGMNKTQIVDMMTRGYETNDMDKVGAAMGWAVENGFDAKTLQSIAYRNYKGSLKKALLQ
jgi:hypothetical protein